MTTEFTHKYDNIRVLAATNTLNNVLSPITISIQTNLSSLVPPFRVTIFSQSPGDPTSDPTTEKAICTAVGSSTVTLSRPNPVAHPGRPS